MKNKLLILATAGLMFTAAALCGVYSLLMVPEKDQYIYNQVQLDYQYQLLGEIVDSTTGDKYVLLRDKTAYVDPAIVQAAQQEAVDRAQQLFKDSWTAERQQYVSQLSTVLMGIYSRVGVPAAAQGVVVENEAQDTLTAQDALDVDYTGLPLPVNPFDDDEGEAGSDQKVFLTQTEAAENFDTLAAQVQANQAAIANLTATVAELVKLVKEEKSTVSKAAKPEEKVTVSESGGITVEKVESVEPYAPGSLSTPVASTSYGSTGTTYSSSYGSTGTTYSNSYGSTGTSSYRASSSCSSSTSSYYAAPQRRVFTRRFAAPSRVVYSQPARSYSVPAKSTYSSSGTCRMIMGSDGRYYQVCN